MNDLLQAQILDILAVVGVAVLGIIARQVSMFLKKKGIIASIESHKEVANIVVNAVEQSYKHLHGEEKLNLAKIELMKLGKEKGLKITEKELDLLIESSVKKMNTYVKAIIK